MKIRPNIAVTRARLSLTFQPDFPMQHIDLESAVSRQSWEWLFDLAPRLDIVIEMVDSHGVPVFPVGSTQDAAAFRTMLSAPEFSVQAALADVRSKKLVFLSIESLQVVCCALATGGVLLCRAESDWPRFGGGVPSGSRVHCQLASQCD